MLSLIYVIEKGTLIVCGAGTLWPGSIVSACVLQVKEGC